MKKKIIIGIAVFAGIIIFLYAFFFQVKQTDYVIILKLGKPKKVIDIPGLYFRIPFIETLNKFEKRGSLINPPFIQFLTKDKKSVVIRVFLLWKISDPLKFFETLGTRENAESRLLDIINSQTGAVMGKYTFNNLASVETNEVKIKEMEKECGDRIAVKIIRDFGIKILLFGFEKIQLPEDNLLKVYNRMRAEREAEASKYRAEGRKEANIIIAGANREKAEILAKAYKESEIIKGEGERIAIKNYAEAHNKNPQFYEYLRSLEAYKKILSEKSTVVLSTDNPLFKFLKQYGIKYEVQK